MGIADYTFMDRYYFKEITPMPHNIRMRVKCRFVETGKAFCFLSFMKNEPCFRPLGPVISLVGFEMRFAMNGQKQISARSCYSLQFRKPLQLQIFRQMSKYTYRINKFEIAARKIKRRLCVVVLK